MTDQSSSVYGGVGVDGHAEHVDGDVMVIPTDQYEIVGMVVTAEMLFSDVVDLEPVS